MWNGYSEGSLQGLYRSSDVVRRMLDFFGKRTRTRDSQLQSMKIELRKGLEYRITIDELYNACVEMEKTGYITFEKDTKDKGSSKVIWKKSLPEILAAASASSPVTPGATASQSLVPSQHPFRTIDGRELSLPYFNDLAEKDAERIGNFYKSVGVPTAAASAAARGRD